ncbi:hypothetical protein CI109_103238 [Kwoniella shandongensis]|uniref:Cation efflux protein transmembrane domain-containing protein n=1 Tax=Kwoniella shandongensis TaxID=1734106 RepID=A0A5M6CDQ7_9TREE|nr:uncharacterized protein CI109_000428 [Kwoniella shandongensis]KAA5531585.1 hypothetical protein CI109_000428 [Kwoniella shandongensis]
MTSLPARHSAILNGQAVSPGSTSQSNDNNGGYFFNPAHGSSSAHYANGYGTDGHTNGSSHGGGGAGPKRLHHGKGLTFEEAHAGGILSDEERSLEFDGLPISDDEIKRLPKKLRPYYTNLALLHAHYLEVDSILSGSLPRNIALSFAPTTRTYSQRFEDIEEVLSPGLSRRGSAWKVKQSRMHQNESENGDEAGEETGLLGIDKREERREKLAKLALNVNTIVNIILVAGKTFAVLYSSSISLTASLVDSALDLLSTFIILGTSLAIGIKSDKHKYPAGKRRFEPLGVLVFSVAMIASFVQVFIESFQRAIGPSDGQQVDVSLIGVIVMLVTIAVKAVLWVWCSRIPSSGVQALAQDAENDVFFNAMSLAFPWVGSLLKWHLLDPIGGMVLSLYIIFEWVKTLLQNFNNLSGKSASPDQITRVLYLVTRFNPVLEIADVECYHIGDDLIVEIDVILPRTSSLHFAHDVGETIQCVIESLDGVLRAYVHCDYSSSNPSQHTARNPHPQGQPQLLPNSSLRSSSSSSSGSATPRPRNPVHFLGINGSGGKPAEMLTAPGAVPMSSPSEMDENEEER